MSVQLSKISLNANHEPYEALSYVWAQEPGFELIIVDGRERQVTTNLFFALRRLRNIKNARILWVDALCIDQQNDVEKSFQVALMGQIYRQCSMAYLWLGEVGIQSGSVQSIMSVEDMASSFHWDDAYSMLEAQGFDKGLAAFSVVHELARDQHYHELPFYITDDRGLVVSYNQPALEAFWELMQQPWWTRMWTLQEAVLPSKRTLVNGPYSILWETFSLASKASRRHTMSCCSQFLMDHLKIFDEKFGNYNLFSAHVGNIDDYHYTSHTVGNSSPPIHRLLWRFRQRGAADPRDKIYALYGLRTDKDASLELFPDYSLGYRLVFERVVVSSIRSQKTLHILMGQHTLIEGLASWTHDWSAWCPPEWEWEFQRFSIADSNLRDAYCTSLDTKAELHDSLDSLLALSGMLVDEVDTVGDRVPGRDDEGSETWRIVSSWFAIMYDYIQSQNQGPARVPKTVPYPGGGSYQSAFERNIMSDIVVTDGFDFQRTYTDTHDESDFNALFPENDGRQPTIAQPRLLRIINQARRSMTGRSFFITKKGYIGLGSPQVGDEIWVLFGGNVPFVLRKCSNSANRLLVGDCYVQGIMDGEAMLNGDGSSREGEIVVLQ